MGKAATAIVLSARVRIKAQFYHLDPMAIVWHGNYVRFFEQARCELLDRLHYNYQQMSEGEYLWPVVDMRVKFIKPVRFGQEMDVTASLKEYENRLKIEYLVSDVESGEKLTTGFTIQVAVDGQSGEMSFILPAEFRAKVEAALCALDE